MNERPYIWMSIAGAVLVVMALWTWGYATGALEWLNVCSSVLGTVGGALLLWALWLAWLEAREAAVFELQGRQKALSMTTMSVTLEAAQSVHPEVLAMVLGDRARRWGLISGTKSKDKSPYSVLQARPIVTDRFVAHFLKMSNKTSYMPKRLLSDGDTRYDPLGIVTAYEMYDAFESLLFEELKATRPFGQNKLGYWLAGWDPDTVAMDFGINLNDYEYETVVPNLNQAPEVVTNALQGITPLAK